MISLLWVGCSAGSRSSSESQGRRAAAVGALTEQAMEERIEAHARYASAVVDELNDRSAEAVEGFYRAALLDHQNEPLVLDVTRRLIHHKEAEKALEILERSTSRRDAGAPLFSRLAVVQLYLGHTNEAVVAAQQALKKDPQRLLTYLQLAQIRFQQGMVTEAMAVLEEAGRVEKADPDGLVALAELCVASSALPGEARDREALREKALQFLQKADVSEPANSLLWQRMADAYLFLGKSEEASDLYLRLLQRWPHLPGLRERLVDIYLRQQDVTKASNQLQSVVRDNPTNVRAQYLLGSLAYDARDMQKAQDHFEKVLILNPDFEQAYYDLAGTQINLDHADQALETLGKAREKFKLRFVTELYSAMAHARLKNYEKAVRHYEAAEIVARATETNRLTHVFYFQIGAAYERNKQYREAESYFRKCLAMAPDFPEVMNYLGYMWAERGENLEEARQLIEKAVGMEPENAAYLDSLAWVLYQLKRPEEALPHMLKALALTKEPDAVLFDHLGDIHAALQQLDQARDAWRRALELEPSETIQKKLDAAVPSPPAKS